MWLVHVAPRERLTMEDTLVSTRHDSLRGALWAVVLPEGPTKVGPSRRLKRRGGRPDVRDERRDVFTHVVQLAR